MDIQNKVFVVTGGASGLGAETSRYSQTTLLFIQDSKKT